MTHSPRTVVRTVQVVLGIVAVGVLTAGTMLSPAAASAAGSARSATVTPSDASSSSDIPDTATIPGSNLRCTAYFRWQVHQVGIGDAYSQVEWTSNGCGYKIQGRSLCKNSAGTLAWATSGEVVRTFLWDRATCANGYEIVEAQVRFNDGSGWGSYVTYWTI
jgi:hypothetical protein